PACRRASATDLLPKARSIKKTGVSDLVTLPQKAPFHSESLPQSGGANIYNQEPECQSNLLPYIALLR
ncbi:hypothetical protein, partial [Kamptonema sp. PCC 6506]|uniref:hypothetical protein n=1 Tax=Kamptonema sp. PCC 6506 TaxID=272129 RepID=UPI001F2DBE68